MNVVMVLFRADPVTPVAIWMVLVLLASLALVMLFDPPKMRRPLSTVVEILSRPAQARARREEEALEAVRFAEEVGTAYERADESADRWHEAWQRTEQNTEAAFTAWQDAERSLDRLRYAGAFATAAATPAAGSTATPAVGCADRAAYLRFAVRDAIERGDLPANAAGLGWDSGLHQADQEFVVQRAVAAHRQELYRQAAAAERVAWHDANLATVSRDSLRREATAARLRVTALQRPLPVRARQVVVVAHRVQAPRVA